MVKIGTKCYYLFIHSFYLLYFRQTFAIKSYSFILFWKFATKPELMSHDTGIRYQSVLRC